MEIKYNWLWESKLLQKFNKIYRFSQLRGRSPSYEEVCTIFSYKSKSSAHYLVKEEYKALIGDDYTVDYFEDFNDSIGIIGRLFEYPDITSVAITDITFGMSRTDGRTTIPRTIPPNIFDKLN